MLISWLRNKRLQKRWKRLRQLRLRFMDLEISYRRTKPLRDRFKGSDVAYTYGVFLFDHLDACLNVIRKDLDAVLKELEDLEKDKFWF